MFLLDFIQYNFEGRFDLVKFVKTVQEAGLFVHLRIGPYACAEWNYGYISVPFSFPIVSYVTVLIFLCILL